MHGQDITFTGLFFDSIKLLPNVAIASINEES